MAHYKSLSELKRLHLGHFFDRGTMRFFNSIVYPNVRTGKDGWYFVTSEQYSDTAHRLFSVRKMGKNGTIDTIGKFQGYHCFNDALEAATKAARAERGL